MIENLAELRRQLLEQNPTLKQPTIADFDLPKGDPRRMCKPPIFSGALN